MHLLQYLDCQLIQPFIIHPALFQNPKLEGLIPQVFSFPLIILAALRDPASIMLINIIYQTLNPGIGNPLLCFLFKDPVSYHATRWKFIYPIENRTSHGQSISKSTASVPNACA